MIFRRGLAEDSARQSGTESLGEYEQETSRAMITLKSFPLYCIVFTTRESMKRLSATCKRTGERRLAACNKITFSEHRCAILARFLHRKLQVVALSSSVVVRVDVNHAILLFSSIWQCI